MTHSNYQDNKKLENCFLNLNCFPWIKLISVELRTSLPLSLSLSHFTLANWIPSSAQSSSCAISHFLYFILPYLNTRHNYWVYQTICQAKSIKFTIKIDANHYILLIKHVTIQQAEPLRAASLSKLYSTENHNSIFNTKCAEFSTKW